MKDHNLEDDDDEQPPQGYPLDLAASVPFALDDEGRCIHAGMGVDPHARHRCPYCGGEVRLRGGRGSTRVHWCHRGLSCATGQAGSLCRRDGGRESPLHKRTKQRIRAWIEASLRGQRPPIHFELRCASPACSKVVERRPLPASCTRTVEEKVTRSGRVVDLALLDEHGRIALAIEVYVTHGVDAAKRRDLQAPWRVPWIEVDARDLGDEGRLVVRQGSEAGVRCRRCAARREHELASWRRTLQSAAIQRDIAAERNRRLANMDRRPPGQRRRPARNATGARPRPHPPAIRPRPRHQYGQRVLDDPQRDLE